MSQTLEHKYFVCNCNETYCKYCDGGLASCTVCGLAEGSLTTNCCGESASSKADEVYAGKVDFFKGKWVEGASVHTPARYRKVEA